MSHIAHDQQVGIVDPGGRAAALAASVPDLLGTTGCEMLNALTTGQSMQPATNGLMIVIAIDFSSSPPLRSPWRPRRPGRPMLRPSGIEHDDKKTILVLGLGSSVTAAGIRSWLGRFGPVVRVDIIPEGIAANPVVLVEMPAATGWQRIWHPGSAITGMMAP